MLLLMQMLATGELPGLCTLKCFKMFYLFKFEVLVMLGWVVTYDASAGEDMPGL